MHILFADESGTAPSKIGAHKEPIFVLGGVVIPESIWHSLRDDFRRTLTEFEVDGEIKWRHFVNGTSGKKGAISHLARDEANALRTKLLQLLVKYSSIRILAVVVDTTEAYRKLNISNPDQIYQRAYKALSERFQYHLQDIERNSGVKPNGIIVADNRTHDEDKRLKDFHSSLVESDSRHTTNYKNIIEGLFIAASHQSIGTQFADLVAGSIYRAHARGDDHYMKIIESAIRKSPEGKIEGYGIVRIPA